METISNTYAATKTNNNIIYTCPFYLHEKSLCFASLISLTMHPIMNYKVVGYKSICSFLHLSSSRVFGALQGKAPDHLQRGSPLPHTSLRLFFKNLITTRWDLPLSTSLGTCWLTLLPLTQGPSFFFSNPI
jgi:hypothetical protein